MGFNDYLDPLINVEGAISISTILLVDVDVGSSPPYLYVPIPWENSMKTTGWGASGSKVLGSKLIFFFSYTMSSSTHPRHHRPSLAA